MSSPSFWLEASPEAPTELLAWAAADSPPKEALSPWLQALSVSAPATASAKVQFKVRGDKNRRFVDVVPGDAVPG